MGLAQASAFAQTLKAQAQDALLRSGLADVRALQALAEMVVGRTH
jgi:farnesyl diphosphate synthase